MSQSVWLIHPDLPRARDSGHNYGADRADFEQDLGLSGNFSRSDVAITFLDWLPITLSRRTYNDINDNYTMTETDRSTIEIREFILHPTSMSLQAAMAYISPNKAF